MTDRALLAQLDGYGLTTAEIRYYRPDSSLAAPARSSGRISDPAAGFSGAVRFSGACGGVQIEAALHSVRIAHEALIGPAEWRAADMIRSID